MPIPEIDQGRLMIESGRLTRDLDLTVKELRALLALAADVKKEPGRFRAALSGRYLSLLFEKPSLRTRLTFELAIKQLGGDSVTCIGPVADREPVKDVARNLDRWTQGIVARTFLQGTVDELARWSEVPVVNALSDLYHPCQALADLQTMQEVFGDLKGLKLAYVGDGNNVAHSLMLNATRLGMNIAVATPPGYGPDAAIVDQARHEAREGGAALLVTHYAEEAVEGADAVYTDVWTSMGRESESEIRRAGFQPYQVNAGLMARAKTKAVFMHCLPAKRGEETRDEVIESAQSVVFDQAENRLHAQKALLLMLIA